MGLAATTRPFYDPKDSRLELTKKLIRTLLSLKSNSHFNAIWIPASGGAVFPYVEGAERVSMNLAISHIHKGGAIARVLGNQGPQLHFPVQKIEQVAPGLGSGAHCCPSCS